MKKPLAVVAVVALTMTMWTGVAHATAYTAAVTPTTGLHGGDTITISATGLGDTQGVYASVCKAGATMMDTPSPCDDVNAVWITAAGGGGSSATSATTTVSSNFGGVDCTVDSCVVYFRGDHNNQSDFSLIRVVELSFATGGPTRTSDTAIATFGDVTLHPNEAGTIRYRTPITLSVTADSGLPVRLMSLTRDCAVEGNVVTALIGDGVCAIAATTAGNDTYSPLNVNFPFYVKMGMQKIHVKKLPTTVSIKKPVFIKRSSIVGRYSALVKLQTTSPKICTVTAYKSGWAITGRNQGNCEIRAYATGKKSLWHSATRNISISIR